MLQYGFRETTKPRNHETRGAYEPYRICEICAISRKTIDEAAVVMGISGDLQSPQKWSKPRAL